MIGKTAGAVVVALVAVDVVIATPQVASAGTTCDLWGWCGQITHRADTGYDAPILVKGKWTTRVPEGHSSSSYLKDVDYVGTRDDEVIRCLNRNTHGHWVWMTRFKSTRNRTQWWAISNSFQDGRGCVVQRG